MLLVPENLETTRPDAFGNRRPFKNRFAFKVFLQSVCASSRRERWVLRRFTVRGKSVLKSTSPVPSWLTRNRTVATQCHHGSIALSQISFKIRSFNKLDGSQSKDARQLYRARCSTVSRIKLRNLAHSKLKKRRKAAVFALRMISSFERNAEWKATLES